ncbi:hypothetical protein NDU88_001926 [Pleurodeles waltl]|uniref:Uncharacterized protein n=1 Tax=Pleurodeles waltl TaxID=8319 RepID=A0AAV7LAX2_PLEWA|nr:hypothetical protein NDU88_001926 [Pleurodeles waltl]
MPKKGVRHAGRLRDCTAAPATSRLSFSLCAAGVDVVFTCWWNCRHIPRDDNSIKGMPLAFYGRRLVEKAEEPDAGGNPRSVSVFTLVHE